MIKFIKGKYYIDIHLSLNRVLFLKINDILYEGSLNEKVLATKTVIELNRTKTACEVVELTNVDIDRSKNSEDWKEVNQENYLNIINNLNIVINNFLLLTEKEWVLLLNNFSSFVPLSRGDTLSFQSCYFVSRHTSSFIIKPDYYSLEKKFENTTSYYGSIIDLLNRNVRGGTVWITKDDYYYKINKIFYYRYIKLINKFYRAICYITKPIFST